MNYSIAITTIDGTLFSPIKQSTPKILNSMKELCIKYETMFQQKYKISRFIPTKKGYKKI